ncbi:hypothetical protein LZ31DRAFT_559458 [Colletotrichum somersetense]|nr:hypothetical protein LZ31DRAFT_559458 [Colletotrichum somersetense]
MGDYIDDDASPPIRVMIVGDSMSQGREGDFTWRYRLWQWMTEERVNFQFVGPYKGTKTPEVPRPPQPPAPETEPWNLDGKVPIDLGGYAAGVKFESFHFSVWGRQATQCKDLVRDQVERFRPDYMLVMLGFNDMGWGVADAEGTIAAMEQLINRTRAANPAVKLAVADVPQPTPAKGTEKLAPMIDRYNLLLRTSVKNWGGPTVSCRAGRDPQQLRLFSRQLRWPASQRAGGVPDRQGVFSKPRPWLRHRNT